MTLTAIDLFAGAGGFSTGAQAAGLDVVWAANHWPLAVEHHAANHPTTAHACQDLHQADWTQVPEADVVLASPACQGHSRARGKDRPHHDATRSTAWAVVSCAEYHSPAAVVVENVPDFLRWRLFPAWRSALEALGYSINWKVIDAADTGVPQHRERVFIVAAQGGSPIHLQVPEAPHIGADSFIDLSAGTWSMVDKPGRAPATLERIRRGRERFGSDPFLMAYYGNERGGRDLGQPIGTITTRDRFAVVAGERMRMLTVDEYRAAMGFPAGYVLPTTRRPAIHLLGNAVCPPAAAEVVSQVAAQVEGRAA